MVTPRDTDAENRSLRFVFSLLCFTVLAGNGRGACRQKRRRESLFLEQMRRVCSAANATLLCPLLSLLMLSCPFASLNSLWCIPFSINSSIPSTDACRSFQWAWQSTKPQWNGRKTVLKCRRKSSSCSTSLLRLCAFSKPSQSLLLTSSWTLHPPLPRWLLLVFVVCDGSKKVNLQRVMETCISVLDRTILFPDKKSFSMILVRQNLTRDVQDR